MALPPRSFYGTLSKENINSGDWNWNGLIAFGSQKHVVILDQKTLFIVQEILRHKAFVSSVKWKPNIRREVDETQLILASGDTSGIINITEVVDGNCLKELYYGEKVTNLEWHQTRTNVLISSHEPSCVCLWENYTLTFRKEFSEIIDFLVFDPFCTFSLAIVTGFKLIVSENFISKKEICEKDFQPLNHNKVKSVAYSSSTPYLFFIAEDYVISVFDTSLKTVINKFTVDKNHTSLVKIFSTCKLSGLLLCVHENGSISSIIWKNGTFIMEAHSSALNLPKKNFVAISLLDPVRQETLVGVLQQGKVIKWRLSSSGEKYKTVGGKHKFVLEGLADRVSASPTCISCKVIDEQNIYAAVGNEVGSLQLINLHTGRVVREFTIHQLPLLGFSWVDANLLYAFSHSSPTKEKFKNIVSCVDLQTGRVYFIRLRKTLESGALRDMKVSFNGGHALLLVGERLEIWELGSAPALLKSTPNAVEVTATTWCMTEAIALHKLRFAAASKGGSIHLFTLEDKIISSDHVFVQSSPPVVVTSLCWKDNYIVSGNATGDLRMYEVGKELPVNLSREVSSEQPVLLKLEFSPIPSLYKLYALYVNRFELWDLSTSSKLSKANKLLKNNREEALGIKDITWANAFLVVLFSNGCIRISDQKLKKSACSMRHSPVPNFWCPSLYNKQVQAYIKSALYTLPGGLSAERSSATTEQMALSTCDYQLSRALVKLIKKVYGEALSSCTSYEECFQLVSEIFGEPFEHAFWSLARLHIPQVLETSRDSAGQTADMSFPCSPLRPFHGIYEDQYGVRKSIESRCGARALASLPQHAKKVAALEKLTLGDRDNAIATLLATDPEDVHFLENSFRACTLVSATQQAPNSSITMMIAVNLLGSGFVDDGVALLCTLENFSAACSYLQDYGLWERAAELAKVLCCTLDRGKWATVLMRWSDYMCSSHVDLKPSAILLQLSIGQFQKAFHLLTEIGKYELAALFFVACHQLKVPLAVEEEQLNKLSEGRSYIFNLIK